MTLAEHINALGDVIELQSGAETCRVFRSGDWVYKFRCTNTEKVNFKWHNAFFGDTTPYEMLGSLIWRGRGVLVLRQPYIELTPDSNRAAIDQFVGQLCKRYKTVLSSEDELYGASPEVWVDGWHFDNLGGTNAGIDANTGKFAVVDCLIRRRNEDWIRDLWNGIGFEIIEHRSFGQEVAIV